MSDEAPQAVNEPEESGAPLRLPPWVPAGIAVALLAMAGLAIYTGLRYRRETSERNVLRKPKTAAVYREGRGAPGEPEPGASFVTPGDHGDNVPEPRTSTATGGAKLEMNSVNGAIVSRVRLSARRGIVILVEPDDAVVYVNDRAVGIARQFGSAEQIYEFPSVGTFEVRLVAPGFNEAEFIVTADPEAKDEVGRVELKLVPAVKR